MLWAASPQQPKVVSKIAAAEFSTLVLVQPTTSTPVSSVYGWGHGNSVPTKVHFPSSSSEAKPSSSLNNPADIVNIIDVDCAKYHNAAVTSTGEVYTWGLHSGPLGVTSTTATATTSSHSSNSTTTMITSPRLVTFPSLLKNNNSKTTNKSSPPLKITSVSTSENITAVLTSNGSLYTWGATYGNDVLGHGGIRFQPLPKQVGSVVRAVSIACAKEHSVLLVACVYPTKKEVMDAVVRMNDEMRLGGLGGVTLRRGLSENEIGNEQDNNEENEEGGNNDEVDDGEENDINHDTTNTTAHNTMQPQPSFTSLNNFNNNTPQNSLSTLEHLSAQKVTTHIDMYNVIPILITANRIQNTYLSTYCTIFIQYNLDGVLAVSKKADLELLLEEELKSHCGILDCLRGNVVDSGGMDLREDGRVHPLILDFASLGSDNSDGVLKRDKSEIELSSGSNALFRKQKDTTDDWMDHCSSFLQKVPPPPSAYRNKNGSTSSSLANFDTSFDNNSISQQHHTLSSPNYNNDLWMIHSEKWKKELIRIQVPTSHIYSSCTKLGAFLQSASNSNSSYCSTKCYSILSNIDIKTTTTNTTTMKVLNVDMDLVKKEIRSLKKKLGRVLELEGKANKLKMSGDDDNDTSNLAISSKTIAAVENEGEQQLALTTEQQNKVARKPILEADLVILTTVLETLMQKQKDLFNITSKEDNAAEEDEMSTSAPSSMDVKVRAVGHSVSLSEPKKKSMEKDNSKCINSTDIPIATLQQQQQRYRCDICSVTCPDENSYTLHMSGRKHRNKVKQVEDEERKETAAAMMEMKRKQTMKSLVDGSSGGGGSSAIATTASAKMNNVGCNNMSSIEPKYKLYPPAKFPVQSATTAASSIVGRTRSCSWSTPEKSAVLLSPHLDNNSGKKNMTTSNAGKKISSFQKILQEEERKAALKSSLLPTQRRRCL